ncbi:hypothetical protein HDU96_007102, partial [Phlyctochytrium bullatum]
PTRASKHTRCRWRRRRRTSRRRRLRAVAVWRWRIRIRILRAWIRILRIGILGILRTRGRERSWGAEQEAV